MQRRSVLAGRDVRANVIGGQMITRRPLRLRVPWNLRLLQ